MAVNLCLRNGVGGELFLWNIRPDPDSRRRLGTECLGQPYPAQEVAGYGHIAVSIRPGDAYCFDGRFIHAVGRVHDTPRSTISFFLGTLPDGTVLQWT